ncbi:MAG: MaoC family dehydratase [Longimonas sp.]|uniref:MaoC family dehydratase n=1 Tax=Longimonas sp. TaxID=2039626 RepID=UPI0033605228
MAYPYDQIEVGDSYSMKRVITAEDVQTFADITGDDNPLHVDPDYAAENSRFGKPVVHGVFLLGLISKVLGRDYPGHGSIAVGISCRFLRPVPVGSEVTVEIKVSDKNEEREHIKVRTYVYLDGKMALGGEGTVIPPSEKDVAWAKAHQDGVS